MNAYELADINDWSCCAHVKEVSVMLRQQADRIAELEKRCLDLCFSEAYANQSTKVTEELLLERIAELEKNLKYDVTIKWDDKTTYHSNVSADTPLPYTTPQTSAEPVAWFEQDKDMKSVWYQCDKDAPNAIALYTTPKTNPLSDEEIISEWIGNDRNYYNFARAIEERILGK